MFNSVHGPFQRSTWHDVQHFVGQELQHSLINTCRTVCHWLKENLSVKKDTFLSPEVGIYKITFYKQKKWNVSTYKALFILIKLNVLLNEINVFLCYTCFKNQFYCWAESLLNEHNFNVFLPGADPEFFLGGAALVVTDWWRSSRRGGDAHPLHPPPRSVPAYMCQMSVT